MDFTFLFEFWRDLNKTSERFEIFFLLDAYDECNISSQDDILEVLEEIEASPFESNICYKIIVSSRKGRRQGLSGSEVQIMKLSIDRRDSEHDVSLYIHNKLQSLLGEGSPKKKPCRIYSKPRQMGNFNGLL